MTYESAGQLDTEEHTKCEDFLVQNVSVTYK